jgi:LuxR family maltose regulon positive regulatory protein
MPETLLRTKLFIPPLRPNQIPRPHLVDRLKQGLQLGHKLTLISAPAGFGKTTLVSEWIAGNGAPVAWLSLDARDNDPARFFAYLVGALGQVQTTIGRGTLAMLQSPQLPPLADLLTSLINDLATIPEKATLVLDDYHTINAAPVDDALTFLLDHSPPQLHLLIATRVDPNLPLARYRARGQMTELRAADLRFTPAEAATFLNQAMGLNLTTDAVAALAGRTEGWAAGLQLAAVSMRGHRDPAAFIASFTGGHHFVLDYLVAEVLEQQEASVRAFLRQTAILDRLHGPLCDAVTGQNDGQATLEALERANLFVTPLDDERRWYRYHLLFADLLRRRLQQSDDDVAALHGRASKWYEVNGMEVEAFLHATAAGDEARAVHLLEGAGVPLYFRGVVRPVLNWLSSLPAAVLDARPALWVAYAMTELTAGKTDRVEARLKAAEAALAGKELDEKTRDLVGRIANTRANVALGHGDLETLVAQSRRALDYLAPDNLTFRTAVTWKLGVAYEFQRDRAAAFRAFSDATASSQASGNLYIQVLATTGVGNIQLADNQLEVAEKTYRHVLELVGDLPIPVTVYVHLCLARIYYEWNDLDAAARYAQQCLEEAQPYKERYEISGACQLFLARLKLAQGDVPGALTLSAQAEQSARQYNFVNQIPEVVSVQVRCLLRQGDLAAAAELATTQNLPYSQARVRLAQGDAAAALALLEPVRRQAEDKRWQDERLKVLVLQAIAHQANEDMTQALQCLSDALALAAPGGFIRTFVDEGPPLAALLKEIKTEDRQLVDTILKLRAAFAAKDLTSIGPQPLVEPLSERELEVLHAIAAGLTNRQIAARLYLSPNTVKVHNRNIFGKLGANNRMEAVTRARALGILSGP